MKEKKIFVTKPYLPSLEEFSTYLQQIWDSSILTNQGPLHNQLETELKGYLGVPNVTLTVNGHMALDIAVKALHLAGEVITTPFTFASTTHTITMNNLTPVFCDIKESDFTIDEDKIEDLITEKTSAIVPVHVYGHPCNVDAIEKIAAKYHLKVLYDAAHAFGVKVDHRPIGNFGDISMFSFHATKIFNTIEGGALTYQSAELKTELDLLKNFGIANADTVKLVGLNAKMNEFQAAMGLCNLKHMEEAVESRKKVVELYRELLGPVSGLYMTTLPASVEYNYAYLPIFIDQSKFGINRDQLVSLLEAENIFPRKYFYPLVTHYDCYQGLYRGECPVAEAAADSVITLPLYAGLEEEDVRRICDAIIRCSKMEKR